MKSDGLFVRKLSYITMIFMFLFTFADLTLARPVRQSQAQKAALRWLKENRQPMGKEISPVEKRTLALSDDTGNTLCYIIDLEPEGFVVISPDDQIEPVIAFSSTGSYHGDDSSPLTSMLRKDMPSRLKHIDKANKRHREKKAKKWNKLLAEETSDRITYESETMDLTSLSASSMDDIRVDSFLAAEWGQEAVSSSPCYNYYTPNNYVSGCVATAMAQVMRYFSYPTSGIGVHSFTILVDDAAVSAQTMGGDGIGGAYDWAQMPEVPGSSITTAQRQAIGALCYDAGVSVEMSYTEDASSASLYDGDIQLVDTFMYSSSVYENDFSIYGDEELWTILNSNLDAHLPVILGISRTAGGHAVIADGYGYNGETMYHHINMGWDGYDNAWYQLPTIDAYYTYTMIDSCVYNISPTGGGEIISGRVTDATDSPIEGATVRAYSGGSFVRQTATNSRGIYAFTDMDSSTLFTVTAEYPGAAFPSQYVTTGTSVDYGGCGNRSGIDFQSASSGRPTAYDVDVTGTYSTEPVDIYLQAVDDGYPDPALLHFVITSLPGHGKLTEPGVGAIETVPYAMDSDSVSVTYTPCPYFGGTDGFTYVANDGGTEPDGGDSNRASVSIEVQSEITTGYHTESSTYSSVLLWTEYYSVRNQVIYLSGVLGSEKRITALAINVYSPPSAFLNDFTIRMKHTARDYYTSTNQIETSGWTTVYRSDETVGNDWNWFVLDTPFDYNGTDNLMIDFSFRNFSTAAPGYGFIYSDSQNRNYLMVDSNGSLGSPLNWNRYTNYSRLLTDHIPMIQILSVPAVDPLTGDFDCSCRVSTPDLGIFSQAWLTDLTDAEYLKECDLTASKGSIDLDDLAILIGYWLEEYSY